MLRIQLNEANRINEDSKRDIDAIRSQTNKLTHRHQSQLVAVEKSELSARRETIDLKSKLSQLTMD